MWCVGMPKGFGGVFPAGDIVHRFDQSEPLAVGEHGFDCAFGPKTCLDLWDNQSSFKLGWQSFYEMDAFGPRP